MLTSGSGLFNNSKPKTNPKKEEKVKQSPVRTKKKKGSNFRKHLITLELVLLIILIFTPVVLYINGNLTFDSGGSY